MESTRQSDEPARSNLLGGADEPIGASPPLLPVRTKPLLTTRVARRVADVGAAITEKLSANGERHGRARRGAWAGIHASCVCVGV